MVSNINQTKLNVGIKNIDFLWVFFSKVVKMQMRKLSSKGAAGVYPKLEHFRDSVAVVNHLLWQCGTFKATEPWGFILWSAKSGY